MQPLRSTRLYENIIATNKYSKMNISGVKANFKDKTFQYAAYNMCAFLRIDIERMKKYFY